MKSKLMSIGFADFIMLACLIFIGGFNEYIACALSVIISAYLIFKLIKNKQISIKINLLTISVALICVMYGITALWAVDFGMALIGFLKFLPLVLFLITICQNAELKYERLLPFFAAITVIISVIGMHIEYTKEFFSVAGRLAGFFQYPNTFALFLLVCELMVLKNEKLKIIDIAVLVVLIAGLLYTGSRTAFVLAIIANIVLIVYKFRKGLKKKYIFIAFGAFAIIAAVVFIFNKDILTRFLSISVSESTFIGRILYWVDALPLILKYPFGMGYLGYSYIQTSIQTGVYTVRFVHNDFLQLILDIGIIPTALFVAAIVKYLFNKNISFYNKIIVAAICAHSFFEFNLQFLIIWFILLLLFDEQPGKEIILKKNISIIGAVLGLFFAAALYMGIHLGLSYFGATAIADRMYPYNTDNKISILEITKDVEYANDVSDDILKQNKHSFIPYTMKSRYSYANGDFASLIEYKRKAIELNPFNYNEYEQYCQMLINGATLYERYGDLTSAKYCKQELILTKIKLEKIPYLQSSLGKLIKDQPKTELSEKMVEYITNCEKELTNAQ